MTDHNESEWTRARNAEVTRRYARLWKAIISGEVPARGDNTDIWYASAQHALGFVLHAIAVERVTGEEPAGEDAVKSAA